MSHPHRLRRPERVRPASLPLRGPLDALDVVLAIVSWPLRPETVCLVLDDAHCGLGSFVVAHDDHGDVDAAVVEVVTNVAAGGSPVAAAVLATMRPGAGPPRGGRPPLVPRAPRSPRGRRRRPARLVRAGW